MIPRRNNQQNSGYFQFTQPSQHLSIPSSYSSHPLFRNFAKNLPNRMAERYQYCVKELSHEAEVSKHIFDSALPPSIIPPVKFAQVGEPILWIYILRSNVNLQQIKTEFVVTPRGMVDSLRKLTDGDVTIGRQQIVENGLRPNDVMLNPTDPSISRTHCKIVYKQGLKDFRDIPPEFMTFLMGTHKRVGHKSPHQRAPTSLLRMIFSYLKEPRKIYATDLGSIFGTYFRITEEPVLLESNNSLLLGPKLGLNVLKTYATVTDYMTQIVAGRMIFEENELIDAAFQGKTLHIGSYGTISMIQSPAAVQALLPCPCLRLMLTAGDPCGIMANVEEHIFLANFEEEQTKFILGPLQFANIYIDSSTLVEIIYDLKSGVWLTRDITNEHYVNDDLILRNLCAEDYGYWKCLSDYKTETRYKPKLVEIKNGVELKISETVLKVTWGGRATSEKIGKHSYEW